MMEGRSMLRPYVISTDAPVRDSLNRRPCPAPRTLAVTHTPGVFLYTHMHKQTNGRHGPLVVLAYSGGLDTSAIVPWLREQYGARVFCCAADVGQGIGELDGLIAKAKRSGAEDCIIEDLREEFVRDFVFPTLRAGAIYARTY